MNTKQFSDKLNMMIKRIIPLMLLILLSPGTISQRPISRDVIINKGDTLIRAKIACKEQVNIKLDSVKEYYWYSSQTIKKNLGGYYGSLLHGSYTEFDMDNNLLCKGVFHNGLKVGIWMYWYRTGVLRCIETWSDGLLNGEISCFNETGNQTAFLTFKNGVKHGTQTTYQDSCQCMVAEMFRNGIKHESKSIKEKKSGKDKSLHKQNKRKERELMRKEEKQKAKENEMERVSTEEKLNKQTMLEGHRNEGQPNASMLDIPLGLS